MEMLAYSCLLGMVLVACVKAVLAVKLLEKDAAAWERLQQVEGEKRRHRQELVGKAVLGTIRVVSGALKKK